MTVTVELVDQILDKVTQVSELYHRLILVVSPPGTEGDSVFKEVSNQTGWQLVNVSLALSEQMLDMTSRQRALRAASLLSDIVAAGNDETVLLDNIEILFDRALQLEPLRLLQSLSRRRTIVVLWRGQVQVTHLTYAELDHPEYRRYPVTDLVLIHYDPSS